jgi:tRNA 2-thiouridine synthesizing protein A
LLAKKALAGRAPGSPLTVLADDPLAVVDIAHMCHREGHAMEGVAECDGYNAFSLRAGVTSGDLAEPPPARSG